MSHICPLFGRERHDNSPYRGHILLTPWSNAINSGQACRPCRGPCSLIFRRGCFGDLLGDQIVVLPPSLIVEPLSRGHKIDGTKPNQTGTTFGDKQGKQTEENEQESSQRRKSSRSTTNNRKHKQNHTNSRNKIEATALNAGKVAL